MLVYCTFYCTLIAHKTDPVNNRLIGLISSRAYQSWLGKKVAKPSTQGLMMAHHCSLLSCTGSACSAANWRQWRRVMWRACGDQQRPGSYKTIFLNNNQDQTGNCVLCIEYQHHAQQGLQCATL